MGRSAKAQTENHFKTQFHFKIAYQNIKWEIIHLISYLINDCSVFTSKVTDNRSCQRSLMTVHVKGHYRNEQKQEIDILH